MKLYLFTFGKLKTPGLRESADYYKRLLSTWLDLQEIELKPLPVHSKTPSIRLKIQEKETELLVEKIESLTSNRGPIYLLDELGKARSTLEWVKEAKNWRQQGHSSISVCIGSSLGFAPAFKQRARGLISLGPQTLSHELARVVILEQLYRTWSVIHGHPYHNEG